jgi:hypothetical protein
LPLDQFKDEIVQQGGLKIFIGLLSCRAEGDEDAAVEEALVTTGIGGLCCLCKDKKRLASLVKLGRVATRFRASGAAVSLC